MDAELIPDEKDIKVKQMEAKKKAYVKPVLIRHGKIDEVTQHGGVNVTDVPIGTPVDGDVTNVASS